MTDLSQLPLLLSGAALLVSLVLLVVILFLRSKLKKIFMAGSVDLSESLTEMKKRLLSLEQFQRDTAGYLEILEKRVARSVQSTELMRFTPFSGIGRNGNQSFSASFINEEGDGIVVSGLYYSNDRVSLFAKPVKAFLSDFELTPEEKEVVAGSKAKLRDNGESANKK
jgi:hypothetical protein